MDRGVLVFLGLMFQASAVFWVWRDWRMSQYSRNDWTRTHRQKETATLRELIGLWNKFGGGSEPVDWDSMESDALEEIAKIFPVLGDDESLRKRKLEAIGSRYGIGPSDSDLIAIQGTLEHLALLRRGVDNYSASLRRKTFEASLLLLAIGFALQFIGSWPTVWTW